MEEFKKIVNFFFELAILKRVQRSGWRNIGIKTPDSVAEHVFVTAQIAYILGKLEGVNAKRAALIALFHDNLEARIGDINLLTKLYLKTDKAEQKVSLDQIENLPGKEEIKSLYEEWEKQETPEATVAKDADWLELAVQAKCYFDSGNKLANLWIKHAKTHLKTESAKNLLEAIEETNIDEWWKEIPEIKKQIKKIQKEEN